MKRPLVIICGILIVALLSGCQNSISEETYQEETYQEETYQEETPSVNSPMVDTPLEQEPFEVELTAENITNDGKPVFKITTNLPDNTELLLTLKNTSGYTAQDEIIIRNGEGRSSSFSAQGNSLSGTYTLRVSMGMPSIQDQSVQDVIGSQGEYMTGSIVQKSSLGSNIYNTVETEFAFTINTNNVTNSFYNNDSSSNTSSTIRENDALISAKQYLNVMAFSYSGLIEQLEYEGYTNSEATYAADNCGADWYEQAALSAQEYLNVMSFSRQELIEQLEFEGFTYRQAVYGVEQNGF